MDIDEINLATRMIVQSLPEKDIEIIENDLNRWYFIPQEADNIDRDILEITATPFWPHVRDSAYIFHSKRDYHGGVGYLYGSYHITHNNADYTEPRNIVEVPEVATKVIVYGDGIINNLKTRSDDNRCNNLRMNWDTIAREVEKIDNQTFLALTDEYYCPLTLKRLADYLYREISVKSGYGPDATPVEIVESAIKPHPLFGVHPFFLVLLVILTSIWLLRELYIRCCGLCIIVYEITRSHVFRMFVSLCFYTGAIFALFYYYHDFIEWLICGYLEGDQREECISIYEQDIFNRAILDIKQGYRPFEVRYTLISFLCVAISLGAISFPVVANTLGEKYKKAGKKAAERAKDVKDRNPVDFSDIRVKVNFLEYQMASNSIPGDLSFVLGFLTIYFDCISAFVHLAAVAAAPYISIKSFEYFLAEQYAREGAEMAVKQKWPNKYSLEDINIRRAVISMLSVSACLSGWSLIGFPGLLLCLVPISIFHSTPIRMSTIAISVLGLASVTTRVVTIMIGTLSIVIFYLTSLYSMRMGDFLYSPPT